MTRASHSIEVHIDELILHGFPPADCQRIAERVERQLARMLAQQEWSALPHDDAQFDQLDGGSFGLPAASYAPASSAAVTGSQIAGAVFSAAASAIAPAASPAASSPAGDVPR